MNEDIRHDESEYYSFEGVGETGTKSCLQTECAAYIEKDTLVLAMDMKAYTAYCKKVITFMINFWMLAMPITEQRQISKIGDIIWNDNIDNISFSANHLR